MDTHWLGLLSLFFLLLFSRVLQSHLMDIIQVWILVADFLMFFFGTLPESYLNQWEEIQHNQDLKIEPANQFQDGF